MSVPAKVEPGLYDELIALPANRVGEIINGQLYARPRPPGPHAIASSALGMELGPPYHKGRGGPGGWWILDEPEVHFVRDTEVVVPDWVCEVLSPSTAKFDRIEKMPLYARYGVAHLWLVDPLAHTKEVYALEKNTWVVAGFYKDDETVSAPPFTEITLRLPELWGEI